MFKIQANKLQIVIFDVLIGGKSDNLKAGKSRFPILQSNVQDRNCIKMAYAD